jgi:hydroxymethylpyrimidine/phosphomethylpyrimidine kinase
VDNGPTFRILCIGGGDPRGGAGVQMDAAVCRALGFEPVTVVTVETEQSARGLESARVRPAADVAREIVAALIAGVDAVKIGALGDETLAETVAEVLEPWTPDVPIVLDPVAQASRVARPGVALNTPAGVRLMQERVFPLADLVTPNRMEYGTGDAYESCPAVVVKGGHGDAAQVADRFWSLLHDPEEFRRARLPGATEIHGTGCAFATIAACHLARCRDARLASKEAGDVLHAWLAGPGLVEGRLVPPPTPRRDWPRSMFTFPSPERSASPD